MTGSVDVLLVNRSPDTSLFELVSSALRPVSIFCRVSGSCDQRGTASALPAEYVTEKALFHSGNAIICMTRVGSEWANAAGLAWSLPTRPC